MWHIMVLNNSFKNYVLKIAFSNKIIWIINLLQYTKKSQYRKICLFENHIKKTVSWQLHQLSMAEDKHLPWCELQTTQCYLVQAFFVLWLCLLSEYYVRDLVLHARAMVINKTLCLLSGSWYSQVIVRQSSNYNIRYVNVTMSTHLMKTNFT